MRMYLIFSRTIGCLPNYAGKSILSGRYRWALPCLAGAPRAPRPSAHWAELVLPTTLGPASKRAGGARPPGRATRARLVTGQEPPVQVRLEDDGHLDTVA